VRYFVIYLAAINILTFCVYGADKRRAKIQGARRVPEKTLFALALLLGSAGALFAMRVFHHKTRHWYFKFGRNKKHDDEDLDFYDDEGYEEEPYINEDDEPQIAEDVETDGDED
jgi:uncharacterized membrane protein YsdA (DUF1294 family)